MIRLRDWLFHPLGSWRRHTHERREAQLHRLRSRYQIFRTLLDDNHRAVELITELASALRSSFFWSRTLRVGTEELLATSADLVHKLERLTVGDSAGLTLRQAHLAASIRKDLALLPVDDQRHSCISLDEITPDMLRNVGGKSANLARLRRISHFAVPSGFVLPVSVCRQFLDQDGLYLRIVARLRSGAKRSDGLPEQDAADEVQRQIMATPLADKVREALSRAAAPFFRQGKGLAVRSSAVGEDSVAHSFAGQYRSVLNVVNEHQLEEAVKQVVASAFGLRNLAYRHHAGLPPHEFDLAILCVEMVDVRSAGILFTRDPNAPASGAMLITAVHGLGELAVSGGEAADVYRPRRDGSGPGGKMVATKSRRLVAAADGGVIEEQLAGDEAGQPVLTDAEIMTLAKLGLAVEERLGSTQDIEWAVNSEGRIVLLQARPLKVMAGRVGPQDPTARKPLLTGGQTAVPGRGVGRVRRVTNRRDLDNLTDPPYVLVMHQSLVEAVGALRQTAALLVDLGNPADHLSCVAREYEVPMLTGLGQGSADLPSDTMVLVDGDRGMVFAATTEETQRHLQRHRQKNASWQERASRPSDPVAAALYDRIVPLNLTDAYGPTFSIAECRTIHDMVRYAHEKAVLAMFAAGDETVEEAGGAIVHLDSEIPFFVSLIDLGGGLVPDAAKRVTPAQVLSQPFIALWQGVMTPEINWGPAGGVAVGSVVSRFLTDHRSARPVGLPNYALVTRDFLNLNARMDFHFTMVDAICGLDARLNYIKFRFKGGGTSLAQRSRRVRCLAEILGVSGFYCDLRDDLLTAAIQGGAAEVLEEKLTIIGRLLGFSRLLDAVMADDELVSRVAQAFLQEDYRLEQLQRQEIRTAPQA
ncbi:MAG: PEP/pyruvate-binding domain-containing protein [Thermodesulfobacteriota bacterium]